MFVNNHIDDRVVAVAGDWHGDTGWGCNVIDRVADQGVSLILHVGDFGIWPGSKGHYYLRDLNHVCEDRNVDIWVTLGNHEDWGTITKIWEEDDSEFRDENGNPQPIRFASRIWVLPVPYRFELHGRSVVSLGGAASVDLERRTEGVNWWTEEATTEEAVQETIDGGYADLMLTHESPDPPHSVGRIEGMLATNTRWSPKAIEYSKEVRERLTRAMVAVAPRLLVHGHWHISSYRHMKWSDDQDYKSMILALDMNGSNGNYEFINLDDDAIWNAK